MLKLTLISLLLMTTSSLAYLGPGMGGGIIAAIFGIIFAIFAMIFGIVWFPLKRFLKKRKEKKQNEKK